MTDEGYCAANLERFVEALPLQGSLRDTPYPTFARKGGKEEPDNQSIFRSAEVGRKSATNAAPDFALSLYWKVSPI
jgi:hypothetical protein